jgi:predicted ester cyclase
MAGGDAKSLAEVYIANAVESGNEEIINQLKAAAPDLTVALDELVAEGDEVVALWHSAGTQTMELWGIPPTDQQLQIRHFTRFTIRDGAIAKAETLTDRMSILAQLRSVGIYAADFGLAPRVASRNFGAR